MHRTHHFNKRLCQRGISADMVDLALQYGEDDNENTGRMVLGRRQTSKLVEEKRLQVKAKERALQEEKRELKLLMKMLDKGGIVVVQAGSALITTYNRNS